MSVGFPFKIESKEFGTIVVKNQQSVVDALNQFYKAVKIMQSLVNLLSTQVRELDQENQELREREEEYKTGYVPVFLFRNESPLFDKNGRFIGWNAKVKEDKCKTGYAGYAGYTDYSTLAPGSLDQATPQEEWDEGDRVSSMQELSDLTPEDDDDDDEEDYKYDEYVEESDSFSQDGTASNTQINFNKCVFEFLVD